MEIKIGSRTIGDQYPTYFIADIAANHDGDLERAKLLIRLAKEAGADAAKFQNFKAAKIVSDYGFKHMDGPMSHQESWKKSVFEVYEDASVPVDWTPVIKDYCDEVGIEYFTSPYDFDSIDEVDPYVPAYKVGSGDLNWLESLEWMAKKGKPVLLATGASEIGEVQRAVKFIQKINDQLVLMQCNTNYTASLENFEHIHLNVLKTYATMFPDVVLGLSDHTPGHATVLGAVTLGARVIEKHFTDDNNRIGPDHKFAMNPHSWADMVDNTRRLELALGSTQKFVAGNEIDTVVVQRRCVRAHADLKAGDIITREMLDVLRPATKGAIRPDEIDAVVGTRVLQDMPAGKEIRWTDVGA
jgi:N-acetylneuraminate synthase